MIISGATKHQIELAIDKVNETYDNNVQFNNFTPMNTKDNRYRVTLRVKSSKEKGHRVSLNGIPFGRKPRRMVAACWHVHGTFFQNLPPDTKIQTVITTQYAKDYLNPFLWPDRNIGSAYYPVRASESCECGK